MTQTLEESFIARRGLQPAWARRIFPLVAIAAGLVALIATIQYPHAPGADALDESWQLVLSHAIAHHLHFGRDLVFTFGPLGWLENRVQLPGLLGLELLWQVASRGLVLLLIGRAVGFRGQFVAVALTLAALCSTPSFIPMADAYYFYVVWLAGYLLIARRAKAGWDRWACIALLAAFALIKFTLAMAACGVVALAAATAAIGRDTRRATWGSVGFLILCLTGWILCRERIGDIPAFLHGSWSVASAYSVAMTRDLYHPSRFFLGLGTAALLVFLATYPARQRQWPLALLTGGLLALVWRHAMSRPDSFHLSNLFVWGTLVALSWPSSWRRSASIAGLILVAWCAGYSFSYLWRIKAADMATVMANAANWIGSPVQTTHRWSDEFQKAAHSAALPDIKAIVGDAPVDVHGFNQEGVILAGLRYVPRPIPQSYSAYNDDLAQRNREWLKNSGTRYSLVQVASIENRLPGVDDGPCLAFLLQEYRLRTEEKGYLLLERGPPVASTQPELPHEISNIEFGTWIDAPTDKTRLQYLRIFVHPSLLRRLLEGFVPLPAMYLDVRWPDGRVESYRLPYTMASSGFLLHPLIRSNDDMKTWLLNPSAVPHVQAFQLRQENAKWLFNGAPTGLFSTP